MKHYYVPYLFLTPALPIPCITSLSSTMKSKGTTYSILILLPFINKVFLQSPPSITGIGFRKERGSIVQDHWCSAVEDQSCASAACPAQGSSNGVAGCLYTDIDREIDDAWNLRNHNDVKKGAFLVVVDIQFPPNTTLTAEGEYDVSECLNPGGSTTTATGNCGIIAERGGTCAYAHTFICLYIYALILPYICAHTSIYMRSYFHIYIMLLYTYLHAYKCI